VDVLEERPPLLRSLAHALDALPALLGEGMAVGQRVLAAAADGALVADQAVAHQAAQRGPLSTQLAGGAHARTPDGTGGEGEELPGRWADRPG
jgi:hypothetical protein